MTSHSAGNEGPEKAKSAAEPADVTGRRPRPLPKPLRRRVVASPVHEGPLGVEREVLAALPEDFLHRYEMVWLKAFGTSVGGRSSHGEVTPNVVASTSAVIRTSTSQTATRGGAASGKKLAGASDKTIISSEAALKFKRKVDAELRKINRLMKGWLTAPGEVGASLGRRCTVCKRFGDDGWIYCPWDGKPMEEREA